MTAQIQILSVWHSFIALLPQSDGDGWIIHGLRSHSSLTMADLFGQHHLAHRLRGASQKGYGQSGFGEDLRENNDVNLVKIKFVRKDTFPEGAPRTF